MSQVTKPIVLDETAQAIKDELHEIGATLGSGTSAVRYDTAQTLTDAQKAQARQNIGAAEESGSGGSVTSVNGQTGAVVLDADDVGAESAGAVSEHNSSDSAHSALFAEKADSDHVHSVSDVTGLSDALAGKSDLGKLKIGNTEYILRIGTTGAAGYITFVLEE